MEGFDFIHSGSIEQPTTRNFEVIANKLKDFKGWKTIDVCGLRAANDEIVFVMYRDDKGNFKQYNSKLLVESYKAIVDDVAVSDKQWEFYDELQQTVKSQGVVGKNMRFLDTTLLFTKVGGKIKNYLTFNVAERVVK